MTKKIISMILALAFCFCMIIPVSAESFTPTETNTTQRIEVTVSIAADEPMPIYSMPASVGGYISNYFGQKTTTLTRNITNGAIAAGVSTSSASGNVFCSVKLPNGAIQVLGSVPASGGSTPKISFATLAKGDYTFIFEASTGAQLYVSGYIYDM